MSAIAQARRMAALICSGSSGTMSNTIGTPPHFSTLPRNTRLFVSMLRPASMGPPGTTSSSPVGMNATFGFTRTGTAVTLPVAMRAATSAFTISPARASTSPRFIWLPGARVPAKRAEGAASISTCCSSADTATCSMTIAVS